VLSSPDWSGFLDCSTRLLPVPVLTAPTMPIFESDFTLSWNAQPAGAVAVLEESADPDFTSAVELLRSADVTAYPVTGRGEGVYYYRLHIELDGNVSAYASAVVTLRKARFAALRAEPARLARIHAAMLRLAGADDGFFAVLSLPRTFRAADAAAYAQALTTLAPGAGSSEQLGADETRLLSFGALYHPWLVARTGAGLVSSPPDGAAAGMMAARAQQRGAWIAPANAPFRDVVGLDPAIPGADLLPLDRARVNVVRHLPDGFVVHDADTLSLEREWRPINVRRLMMLLRRTLMRRGLDHVFEPNGAVLRRAVERSLTGTLDDLQLRGAFAGASSAESFRVAVRASAADVEAGRLVVEISVAPSQPIRFLTMRLIQQGARLTILEEA
jgi:phage tail sheath protein FI